MNLNRNRPPDIEAVIKNNKPSKNYIRSGYCPAFKVKDDYLTSGLTKFKNCDVIKFDEEALADIWFITPEYYPHCLFVGQKIQFQEGKFIQGYATITKIYNNLLQK